MQPNIQSSFFICWSSRRCVRIKKSKSVIDIAPPWHKKVICMQVWVSVSCKGYLYLLRVNLYNTSSFLMNKIYVKHLYWLYKENVFHGKGAGGRGPHVGVGGMASFFSDILEFCSVPLYMIELSIRINNQVFFYLSKFSSMATPKTTI